MAERTVRKPQRPLAYYLILIGVALVSAACIAAAWRLAHDAPPAAESELAQS